MRVFISSNALSDPSWAFLYLRLRLDCCRSWIWWRCILDWGTFCPRTHNQEAWFYYPLSRGIQSNWLFQCSCKWPSHLHLASRFSRIEFFSNEGTEYQSRLPWGILSAMGQVVTKVATKLCRNYSFEFSILGCIIKFFL